METNESPIPGADAIPADMPDAPHGDVSLEYSLQQFNALVAANTAMTTEISGFGAREQAWTEQVGQMQANIDDLRVAAESAQKVMNDQRKAIAAHESVSKDQADELKFAQDHAATLQRRLDRSLGYLDRVLDDEDGHRAPETRTVAAPRPEVGPALGMIPDAIRANRRASDSDGWISARSASFSEPTATRPRRY